jgi:hypothetical protein
MYQQGISKTDIYNELSQTTDNKKFVARAVVALPNPEGVIRYRRSNRVLAILIFLLAILIGLAKFAQAADVNMTAAFILAPLFFAGFAACAWGIWKRAYPAYVTIGFLLFMMIPQTLRSMLMILREPLEPSDDAYAMLSLDLFIGIPFLFFLLWLTIRTRNNIFSKAGFFGGPKKNKDGTYRFATRWELKAMKGKQ